MRVGEVANLRRIRSKSAGVATRPDESFKGGRYISLRSIGLVYEGWLDRIGRVVVPKSRPRIGVGIRPPARLNAY